jgi:hypothetical protein
LPKAEDEKLFPSRRAGWLTEGETGAGIGDNGSAAARPRVHLGVPVAHAPVLRLAENRFAGVIATTVCRVALVVVVAHQ